MDTAPEWTSGTTWLKLRSNSSSNSPFQRLVLYWFSARDPPGQRQATAPFFRRPIKSCPINPSLWLLHLRALITSRNTNDWGVILFPSGLFLFSFCYILATDQERFTPSWPFNRCNPSYVIKMISSLPLTWSLLTGSLITVFIYKICKYCFESRVCLR